MFRRTALVSLPVIAGALSFQHRTFNAEKWPFDPKVFEVALLFFTRACPLILAFSMQGLPTTFSSTVAKVPTAVNQLNLAGVGMRRKNFYIAEVDVYLVGINLSNKALKRAQEWSATRKEEITLVGYLTQDSAGKKVPTDVAISATLRFCRTITREQFLGAFDDSFKGCSPDAVSTFKERVGKVMASGSLTQKDEAGMYWLDNGDFIFSVNGELSERLTNTELNKRLLEVYLDPTRTVSKELYTCLETHLNEVSP